MFSLTHHPNLLGSACLPSPPKPLRSLGDKAGNPKGSHKPSPIQPPHSRKFVLGRRECVALAEDGDLKVAQAPPKVPLSFYYHILSSSACRPSLRAAKPATPKGRKSIAHSSSGTPPAPAYGVRYAPSTAIPLGIALFALSL